MNHASRIAYYVCTHKSGYISFYRNNIWEPYHHGNGMQIFMFSQSLPLFYLSQQIIEKASYQYKIIITSSCHVNVLRL